MNWINSKEGEPHLFRLHYVILLIFAMIITAFISFVYEESITGSYAASPEETMMFHNAKESEDISKCSGTGPLSNTCTAIMKRDKSLCEQERIMKEYCYMEVAKASLDETACEKMDKSKELCYYLLALRKADTSLCDYVGSPSEKCKQRILNAQ